MTRNTPRRGSAVLRDRRAQASTIGVVLILAITILGGGVVVAIGADALNDTEQATSLSKAEHSMTQFDSRAAMVALGETRAQRVELGTSGDGEFGATEGEGWIRVVHKNYTAAGDDEVIYNASLGTVTYVNDETTVAYQGGGVWRQRDNGTAMLSPPEFHYRGATLTLPVIRVTSDDSAAGPTDAYVTRTTESRRIFPNATAPNTDGVGAPYDNESAGEYNNPVLNGTVEVTVHSDYYKGWATYFDTRTAGNVSVDHANKTATVELQTVGVVGDFAMADALDDDGLNVRGQSAGHSVNEFTLAFEKDHGTFNNMYYSFYASEGVHTYETVIHVPGGTKCNDGGVDSTEKLGVYTFYRNETSGKTHVWSNESMSAASGAFRLECGPGNDATIVANLTSDVPQTYDDMSDAPSDEGTYYDWDADGAASEATFGHDGVDGETATFNAGDQHDTRNLTRHYFALLGDDFTLSAQTGTGNRGGPQIDVDNSYGTLDYEAGGGGYYITFLHITENEVEVELE